VAGTAGGWLMWQYALEHLPAGTMGMSSLGTSVVALVGAAIHLGERPSASELTGMGFIIGALALLSFDTIGRQRESVPLMIPE
jgi:drug/metabolite transporter (DMT)-like permease